MSAPRNILKKAIISFVVLVWPVILLAAEYHVDVNTGDDGNPGTLAQPWKTINKAGSDLEPGDTAYVHEGIYYESVDIRVNGEEDNRIIFKNYQNDKVVLDGRDPLTGWQKCQSKAECFGNLNYEKIYYTTIPVDEVPDIYLLNLFEGDYFLQIARDPNQSDPTQEQVLEYRPLEEESFDLYDGIIDTDFLTQPNDFWNGAHILIWSHAYNNAIIKRKIADFIHNERKIIFDELMEHPISKGSRPDGYCIVNHPLILDKAGEFYLLEEPDDNNNYTIYFWPYNENSVNDNVYRVARTRGFYINHSYGSYVTIDGFEIRNFGRGSGTREGGIICPYGFYHKGLTIRNCVIHDISGYGGISLSSAEDGDLVEHNIIYNIKNGKGIFVSGGNNHTIQHNFVRNTQSTCIGCYGVKRTKIIYNTASMTGNHGNGITTYLSCSDVLVANNKVSHTGACETLSTSSNITIYNNLYYGGGKGGYLVANWGGMTGFIRLINNTIVDSSNNASAYLNQADEIICKNNILDGGGKGDMSHNLFVDLGWWQRGDDYEFGEGEVVEKDLSLVFTDYDNLTFSIKSDGPAYQAGTDITQYLPTDIFPEFDFNVDLDGNPIDKSGGHSIGAYISGPVSFEIPGHVPKVIYPEAEIGFNINDYNDVAVINATNGGLLIITNNIISSAANSSALITAAVDASNDLQIIIYDTKGRKIKTIHNGPYQNSTFQANWYGRDDDGAKMGSGIYLVLMKNGGFKETKKIAVVK